MKITIRRSLRLYFCTNLFIVQVKSHLNGDQLKIVTICGLFELVSYNLKIYYYIELYTM